MPTISPARNSSDTPARRGTPRASRHCRPAARISTAPVRAGVAPVTRPRLTWRPTIACARPSRSVSAMRVSSTTAPPRITVTASASAMISFSLCVISRIVVPRSRNARSVTNSCSVSCGVSTAVGSSRIRMRAPRTSAFRISSRWRSPTGRSATVWSSATTRPVSRISASSRARSCLRAARQEPRRFGTEHHVVERRQRLDQHEMLVHHADAQRDRVACVRDAHRPAFDLDAAAVGLVEAVQDRHQRALAGAVLADDAVHGAGRHCQVDRHVRVHRAETFVDRPHGDCGRGGVHSASSVPCPSKQTPRNRLRRAAGVAPSRGSGEAASGVGLINTCWRPCSR